jgi:hypothetical protein
MRLASPVSLTLLAAGLLHAAVAAPLAAAPPAAVAQYRRFPKSDCPGDDVKPQPTCGGNRNLSVAMLEACCTSTLGCDGFNTHGVIKRHGCATNVHAQPTTDLYLVVPCNVFKSQPNCPLPRCAWKAAASGGGGGTCSRNSPSPPPTTAAPPPMPWPLPNKGRMSTGATTVQLSHGFAISRKAGGPACPTLDTALKRYQNQAVGMHIARPQEASSGGGGGPVLLQQLLVAVNDLDESYPQLNTTPGHEAYTLFIPADGTSSATVHAETIWGAMWGLESFSQVRTQLILVFGYCQPLRISYDLTRAWCGSCSWNSRSSCASTSPRRPTPSPTLPGVLRMQ